jgi:hypothetical protein
VKASGAGAVAAIVVQEGVLRRPLPPIVRILRRKARQAGLLLVDVLGVTSVAFGSLLCRDAECCPVTGRPIERVMSSRGAIAHVLSGDTVAEEESELLADVVGPPEGESGRSPADRPPLPLDPRQRVSWWQRWLDACALIADRVSTADAGRSVAGLSWALHDPYLRDAVLMHVLGAPTEQVRGVLHGLDQDRATQGPLEPDFGELLARPPGPAATAPGADVLAAAARVAPAGERAPALAVLAMLAWYEGRGGRSRLLVERARTEIPGVSLTRLVEDLLVRRVPPPWRRKPGERP